MGQAIKDLPFPEHCVIAAIIRQGEVVVPRGMTVFDAGDEVLAITDPEGAKQLAKMFASQNTIIIDYDWILCLTRKRA